MVLQFSFRASLSCRPPHNKHVEYARLNPACNTPQSVKKVVRRIELNFSMLRTSGVQKIFLEGDIATQGTEEMY